MSDAPLHPVLGEGAFGDDLGKLPVQQSQILHEGAIFDLQRDTVDLGESGGTVEREFLTHGGAVVVLALDDQDRVVMIQQYRHAVGARLWELPAGLLDEEGEPPHVAAARELAEEVDLRAATWHVLADFYPSAGWMAEAQRIYLARDLSVVPEDERHEREHEEADLRTGWFSLDEAHEAVLAGRLNNSGAVIGILTAHAARARGWETLRPVDAPWPEHPAYR